MKKKILALVLTLSIVLSFMPVIAIAESSGTCGDNLTWTLDDCGTLTISGTGAMTNYNYPPTDISRPSAWDNATSLVIEDGVTSIGYKTFWFCEGLINVTIPNSVTSIGQDAFNNCSSLTSITIPDSVTYIGSSAFSGCDSLTSVAIPDSVTCIDSSAFSGCDSLTNVTIGNGVASIYSRVFSGCSSLANVTIGNCVTYIGNDAFYDCYSLESVYISDIAMWCDVDFRNSFSNPLIYTDNLYVNNELVTDLVIPSGVTSIGNYAFEHCYNLTSVTIPDGVTSIGSNVFCGCGSMTSVTIPNSVTSIGSGAFYGCNNIDINVYITDITAWCNIGFADNYANPLAHMGNLYVNNEVVTSIVIPDSIITIKDYAFSGCDSLTSVTIPNSVTSIGYMAFESCSNLTSVIIPDSIASIGGYAFEWCSSLKNVTIPDSVTAIEASVFRQCHSLTSVTVPEDVTSIGEFAFYGCSSLTDVYYSGTQAMWDKISISDNNNDDLLNATLHCSGIEPTPNPTYIPMTQATVTTTETDTAWSLDVVVDEVYENSYVYVAVYDSNNTLIALNKTELDTEKNTNFDVAKVDIASYAKVFVWTNVQQPTTIAERIELTSTE